jgi:hypothetical protein
MSFGTVAIGDLPLKQHSTSYGLSHHLRNPDVWVANLVSRSGFRKTLTKSARLPVYFMSVSSRAYSGPICKRLVAHFSDIGARSKLHDAWHRSIEEARLGPSYFKSCFKNCQNALFVIINNIVMMNTVLQISEFHKAKSLFDDHYLERWL